MFAVTHKTHVLVMNTLQIQEAWHIRKAWLRLADGTYSNGTVHTRRRAGANGGDGDDDGSRIAKLIHRIHEQT